MARMVMVLRMIAYNKRIQNIPSFARFVGCFGHIFLQGHRLLWLIRFSQRRSIVHWDQTSRIKAVALLPSSSCANQWPCCVRHIRFIYNLITFPVHLWNVFFNSSRLDDGWWGRVLVPGTRMADTVVLFEFQCEDKQLKYFHTQWLLTWIAGLMYFLNRLYLRIYLTLNLLCK